MLDEYVNIKRNKNNYWNQKIKKKKKKRVQQNMRKL